MSNPLSEYRAGVRLSLAVFHRLTSPPSSPTARVCPFGLKAMLRTALPSGKAAVRCPLAVSHRPTSPPSSPAARVWPFGLKATLSTGAPLGQSAGPLPAGRVPQPDVTAAVANGQGRGRSG